MILESHNSLHGTDRYYACELKTVIITTATEQAICSTSVGGIVATALLCLHEALQQHTCPC